MQFDEYLPIVPSYLPLIKCCALCLSADFRSFEKGALRPKFLSSHLAVGNWAENARKTNRETCHKNILWGWRLESVVWPPVG